MKSIEMLSGGPVMPRSKSRAIVRSLIKSVRSRWATPGGSMQAIINCSFNQFEVRLPRFMPSAKCTGVITWKPMNTTPTNTSGIVSESPPLTAPTSAPVASASSGSITPRNTSTNHHVTDSAGAAWCAAPKNAHSWRAFVRVSSREIKQSSP